MINNIRNIFKELIKIIIILELKMRLLSVFSLALTTLTFFTFSNADRITFTEFKNKYGKSYSTVEEESMRENIFYFNQERIERENSKGHTYTLDINAFTDLTQEEFFGTRKTNDVYSRIVNFHKTLNYNGTVIEKEHEIYNTLPQSIDWTSKGVVTPVKNQEQCGSCWAFSTTGAIESAYAIKTSNLLSLSEQQLVDCSVSYGNMGCQGGIPVWAYEYIMSNGGICSESDYPYRGVNGVCESSSCTPVVSITGYKNVTVNSGSALKDALSQQPVSVIIEADQTIFQFYSGGVITSGCGNNLDHAVLATGYSVTDDGQEYFKIKNSWGESWGLNGYVLFGADVNSNAQNGGSGVCGVLSMPTFPTV